MTRTQLILCTTAFSAVVYLPGASSRAAVDPVRDGRGAAQLVRTAAAPSEAPDLASRASIPERPGRSPGRGAR